jgi:hypothetical protein
MKAPNWSLWCELQGLMHSSIGPSNQIFYQSLHVSHAVLPKLYDREATKQAP